MPFSTRPESAPPERAAQDENDCRESLWLFPKGQHLALSANFGLREFSCHCRRERCHFTLTHPVLVQVLQTLRELMAQPLSLSSGYRCPQFNRLVGGSPRSYHTRGMAADIVCRDAVTLEELAAAALRIPAIGGLGRYPGRGFVHVDVRRRAAGGLAAQWTG